MNPRRAGTLLLTFIVWQSICAAEIDEFAVKREAVFEFDEKPRVTAKEQKAFEITFASKGWCDATVAIETADGKILRHLASGVLGPKAPEPFQKDSKKQSLLWDGKDDRGNYPTDEVVVRVSLGLKASLEKTLLWDPRKRASNGWGGANAPIMKSAPEGVYVYDAGGEDHLRLFDHDGNYVRTIYPFPSNKLDAVVGLQTHTFPHDGKTLPWKAGFLQSTLLFGKNAKPMPTRGENGFDATSMAIAGNHIALAGTYISRLATDGSTGGMNLAGPKVVVHAEMHGANQSTGHDSTVRPCSAALSPDGKSLYLSGYLWRYTWHNDSFHGVTRVAMDQDGEPQLFAGSMKQDDAGTENGKFRCAVSVACDSQGRVYVADHMNDRIQVFSPDGKFLKAIPVFRPAVVCVHPKSGEIYAFSWVVNNRFTLKLAEERQKASQPPITIEPKLVNLGTFDAPKESGSFPLPLPKFGGAYSEWYNNPPIQTVGDVDFNTEPPTIWISQSTSENFKGEWDKLGIQVLREKGGKLEVLRDFGADAAQSVARATPAMLDRQRLYVNPKTEKLYVAEADSGVGKSFKELLEIDPVSGQVKRVPLPYAAEDMAFDNEGAIYLRSDNCVVRYDPSTWREIPWDYGEESDHVSFDGGSPTAMSALVTPGHRSPSFWHMGGMYVNAQGYLAIACPNVTENFSAVAGEENKKDVAARKVYAPRIYPGRLQWGEIHIFDKHGKLIADDAFPGMGHMNGIGIDTANNVYVMANGKRLIDGKSYDPNAADDLSETVTKVKCRAAKVLSSNSTLLAPLAEAARPKRAPDFEGFPNGASWIEGAEWFYGGVGYTGNAAWDGGGCRCWNARFCLDYFARSFAPETRHFSVAVLDANGNLILRIGKYGNVDDGTPIDAKGGPPTTRSIGGDEVSLFHAAYLGTLSDRRLYIADAGNARIVSVKLGYVCEERLTVKAK